MNCIILLNKIWLSWFPHKRLEDHHIDYKLPTPYPTNKLYRKAGAAYLTDTVVCFICLPTCNVVVPFPFYVMEKIFLPLAPFHCTSPKLGKCLCIPNEQLGNEILFVFLL